MKPYADTNHFTRLYLPLAETAEAEALATAARIAKAEPLPVTWLLRVELTNALELHVFFGKQSGHVRVAPQQAAVALESFRDDVAAGAFLRDRRVADADLARQVEELAQRHTARHGFRVYDLLHVASALLLECDTFWSFDERALKLARLEGLQTPPRHRR